MSYLTPIWSVHYGLLAPLDGRIYLLRIINDSIQLQCLRQGMCLVHTLLLVGDSSMLSVFNFYHYLGNVHNWRLFFFGYFSGLYEMRFH